MRSLDYMRGEQTSLIDDYSRLGEGLVSCRPWWVGAYLPQVMRSHCSSVPSWCCVGDTHQGYQILDFSTIVRDLIFFFFFFLVTPLVFLNVGNKWHPVIILTKMKLGGQNKKPQKLNCQADGLEWDFRMCPQIAWGFALTQGLIQEVGNLRPQMVGC